MIPGGRSLPRGQVVGTVWAAKESLMGPTRPGSILHQVRIYLPATCAASWSAYLAALGVQVREAGTGAHVDQDLGALVTRCGGWALGPSDQVQQL